MEQSARTTRRHGYVRDAVLATVAGAGIVALAAVAPGVLTVLGKSLHDRRFTYQTKTVLSRLASRGHIRFVTRSGKQHVEITDLGRRELMRSAAFAHLTVSRKKRWDKRWRMIMFDIPERRRKDRDRLRHFMLEAGFVQFQQSVWIYPYECEDLVTLLKVEMRLGNSVRYAIIEKLENDASLKRQFNLP